MGKKTWIVKPQKKKPIVLGNKKEKKEKKAPKKETAINKVPKNAEKRDNKRVKKNEAKKNK